MTVCFRHGVWVFFMLVVLLSCGQQEDKNGDEGGVEEEVAESAQIDSAEADTLAEEIEAVPVEIAHTHIGEISSYLLFNSTIETEAAVEIYPQISGMVERVAVEEGDRVEVGDTLLHIEDDQLRIADREARVNLDYQQTSYQRTEEMFKRKLISDQEFETKKYELAQARLRCERVQLELEHAAILAPFSGMITGRKVQGGARVGSGSKLYDLIKLDDMIARVFVPGQYLTAIRNQQRASITSEFLPDKFFKGWVKRISPVVDPRSGTFKVTVGLHERFEYLRPGLSVSVQIITDTHQEAVLIPKQAVVYDGGDKYVFAVRDTIAEKVQLVQGFENADFIEALADVDPGTPIIIVGQTGLKDQARVRVINDQPASKTGIEFAPDEG